MLSNKFCTVMLIQNSNRLILFKKALKIIHSVHTDNNYWLQTNKLFYFSYVIYTNISRVFGDTYKHIKKYILNS